MRRYCFQRRLCIIDIATVKIGTYLVKNLLNLETIGLKYKDHIASAVALSSKIKGDGYKVNGKLYYVADPTFVNANIGETMTKYKNKIPKAIY